MSISIASVNNQNNFVKTANYYHEKAEVQQEVAERLIASLKPWRDILPPGPIIELGCGTGFVSEGLVQLFEKRELILSDESPTMLEFCKDCLNHHENLSFKKWNAEELPVDKPTYAMTISSFVAQWFQNPAYTLGRWLEVTQPGGLLLAAFPGNESFPEWKKHAETLGIPFTGNALPDTEEMVVKLSSDHTQVDYYEDTITQQFASAVDFFRHLKRIGAGHQFQGRHLSPREMRLLINHWDESQEDKIEVSYHIVFLAVKRNA